MPVRADVVAVSYPFATALMKSNIALALLVGYGEGATLELAGVAFQAQPSCTICWFV
jgi:hypothetical protein